MPTADTTMFLPHRPYLPLGSLRAVLAYPAPEAQFDDARICAALRRVGLGRLASLLDRDERWDQTLTLDEQQRVAFVRVVLHAPRWVVHDEAMSAIDDDGRSAIRSIFENELAAAAVVGIGRAEPDGFYRRILTLRLERNGLSLPLA
jgi:putative ATP-binding cassette transporter